MPDRAIQEFAGWASPDMITRYDKRRTSVEESATHSIHYGSENRSFPATNSKFEPTPGTGTIPQTTGTLAPNPTPTATDSMDSSFLADMRNAADLD